MRSSTKKDNDGLPRAPIHALLDVTALAGAATGAVAGAMAGPPGVVVGGTVGAAIGVLAGRVLDEADHEAEQHNRDLDDAIGVSAAELLRAEHARLEVIYDRLLEAYAAGDWNDVCAEWEVFEPSLRAHMALEEKCVFPVFREVDPDEADYLLAEHDALRTRLDVLGVNVELHAVTPFDAQELVERLRAHRAREERLLYPWIDATFDRPIARGDGR